MADERKEIPRKVLDRYRKLLTLAEDDAEGAENERLIAAKHVEKIEARWPGIRTVVERVEKREQARAAKAGKVWTPPRPTRDEIEAMLPKAMRKVGDLLGLRLVDLTESALDWATRQIEEAADDYVWLGYQNGNGLDPGGMVLLKDLIENEIGLEIEEADDDETGDTLVVFTLEIPVDVWRRVADSKNGASTLIRHLDVCYTGAEAEDEVD